MAQHPDTRWHRCKRRRLIGKRKTQASISSLLAMMVNSLNQILAFSFKELNMKSLKTTSGSLDTSKMGKVIWGLVNLPLLSYYCQQTVWLHCKICLLWQPSLFKSLTDEVKWIKISKHKLKPITLVIWVIGFLFNSEEIVIWFWIYFFKGIVPGLIHSKGIYSKYLSEGPTPFCLISEVNDWR